VYEIDVSMQTDNVENIPCGTSGGVMIYFDRVEVCGLSAAFANYPRAATELL
jgi:hypothetical protein